MKDRKIIDMTDAREEQMIRQALAQLAEEEIRAAQDDASLDEGAEAIAAAVQRHIARTEKPVRKSLRRSLRAVAVIAAVLVTFSGVCLATPEIRNGLFRFTEKQWGRYREVRMHYEGTEDAELAVTVLTDDQRLEYVWEGWPLHYYPLYLPEDYRNGEKLYTFQYATTSKTDAAELTAEEQQYLAELVETDYLAMEFYSTDPQKRNAITFAENGQNDAIIDFESVTNEVSRMEIDGRDVQVVKAGSSYRCFWQQDDHILILNANGLPWNEVEEIIANVERIR